MSTSSTEPASEPRVRQSRQTVVPPDAADEPHPLPAGPLARPRAGAHDPVHVRRQLLRDALEHAGHYLSAQAPLEVFVHHNTLHAFQHLPFHAGLRAASKKLQARCYLPEAAYQESFREGRITDADLQSTLADRAASRTQTHGSAGPDGAWPAVLPPADDLLLLIQRYGLRETSPAGLSWHLDELAADRRARSDLPAEARKRLLSAATPAGDVSAEQEARIVGALWQACVRMMEGHEVRSGAPHADPRFPRELLVAVAGEDPNDLVHPELIPLCAAFLDRGQAHFTMPLRAQGFHAAWSHLQTSGYAVRPAWERRLGQRLRGRARPDAESAVLELLEELRIPDGEIHDFVEHVLLQLPSWAGMFQRLEGSTQVVGLLGESPLVTLVDFLAVRLSLDVLAYLDLAQHVGFRGPLGELVMYLRGLPRLVLPTKYSAQERAWPLFNVAQLAGLHADALHALGPEGVQALLRLIAEMDEPSRLQIWHDAFERHYRNEVLAALTAHRPRASAVTRARFQVVCCIDDRMESFRRHLEENHADVETFGAAGFFNLAIAFQGLDDPFSFPLCPVVIRPQHHIVEEPTAPDALLFAQRLRRRRRWQRANALFARASRSLLLGSVLTALTGWLATLPLLFNVFLPKSAARLRRLVTRTLLPEVRTQLSQLRTADARATATADLFAGFSVEEKASRVAALLQNMGLTRDFAPLVVVLGHDSSSVNNPHFAAYSCGACGGRSGGPNARLFARMANRPEVRALLRQQGIEIPVGTMFVGGVHDTCTDAITLFDESVPPDRSGELGALRSVLQDGLVRHAHERCRRFASAPVDASLDEALAHVEERAADLSQARPELGHATNAACIVGRRSLSQGVFLDRRAFLVSYDPVSDPDGLILERILLAVGPVCAGINLEYFFSTVDNERLGAGTKLPHNVTGLIAVMNGVSSDLRTGLPKQMIEIHEPMRLQLVLDASPQIVLTIMKRQQSVAELIENQWVQAVTMSPDSGEVRLYSPGRGFVPWTPPPEFPRVPVVRTSHEWYRGKRGFVSPAVIERPARQTGEER